MKGDFSRYLANFDPANMFTRVLLQQGRVMLDADQHEQTEILLHALWALARDLIGPYGGPKGDGFAITAPPAGEEPLDLAIGVGRYYVDGIMVENANGALRYREQAHYVDDDSDRIDAKLEGDGVYLAYLDVWERHVTYVETDAPIREIALGEVDTATRAQLVAQVRLTDEFVVRQDDAAGTVVVTPVTRDLTVNDVHTRWNDWLQFNGFSRLLKARAGQNRDTAACIVPPDARYRGLENQLYRVEVHTGGEAGTATFKYSRDNGSVVFPLREPVDGKTLYLEHLGRDPRFGLQVNDWVEVVDDDYSLRRRAAPLLQVTGLDPVERTVELSGPPNGVGESLAKHPLLRRWDHRAGLATKGGLTLRNGAAEIKAGTGEANWLALEDGIEIQFQPDGVYQTGDYWLIPARTASGDIEWPGEPDAPLALPPHGVEHHYAPLAIVSFANGMVSGEVKDARKQFEPLAK